MSKKEKAKKAAAPAKTESAKGFRNWKIFHPETAGGLTLRIVIALAIPYAYLMLCGLIFDKWLHLYNLTMFIFISLCVLYLLALAYIVACIVCFTKRKKSK